MRAVLGLALALAGAWFAYEVIIGHFPPASAPSSTSSAPPTTGSLIGAITQIVQSAGNTVANNAGGSSNIHAR